MPRITPQIVLFGALFAFIFVSFILYNNVDSSANQREAVFNQGDREISQLKAKLERLNVELSKNEDVVNSLQKKLEEAKKPVAQAELPPAPDVERPGGNKVEVVAKVLHHKQTPHPPAKQILMPPAQNMCPATDLHYFSASNIQMLQAYDTIPFDNVDGGVWKQGWEISYDSDKILQEKKLEVVVIPHSHDDPGWLQTFEGYYQHQTKGILDGMAEFLPQHPEMKFIYAEMSFFELWWSTQTEETRKAVRSLLNSGQLEIVTGAWVMTDEANAHYFATVMEMFEGHEFLLNQMDYRPSNHWSIDPFGLSPTLSYIVKAGNLSHAAVQRVHYSVKKFLAQNKNLEFKWRQLWAGESDKTDIFTHMFPFYSYDIPHTCGPDPKICCQFDFRRSYSFQCPWGIPPQAISEHNAAERAATLADQYRKKAQLYKTNVLLVPLGDDFRYDDHKEWREQFENYQKLFAQMNSDPKLNMHARFGTLKDYFSLLEKRQAEEPMGGDKMFDVLSGDFFTYADRDDHYWSGYFTSRPFYKHMDRTLQHLLRSADMLFSLANWKSVMQERKWTGTELYNTLVDARRALSLFQHHDGVTGTAKDPVVVDYGEKMLAALNWCKQIIASSAEYLLKFPQSRESREQNLRVDEEHFVDKLPLKTVIEDGSTVVVHNSLAFERSEVVCIHVTSFKSRITKSGSEGHTLQQLGPLISIPKGTQRFAIDKEKFELCFVADVAPFGFTVYEIFEAQDTAGAVSIESSHQLESSDFETTIFSGNQLEIKNDFLEAQFELPSGFLKSVKLTEQGVSMPTELSFVHYGARGHNRSWTGGDSLSGAYLFLPNGEAKVLSTAENSFVRINGPVRQTVLVKGPKEILLTHSVSLDIGQADLQIKNHVDIRSQGNFEAAMRIKTGVIDGEHFFTDLNGYQLIRRKRFEKLPLQAHFYPMPASAFVENNQNRVALLGRQALGVASLKPGWIEVMLDRRLDQDDDRGVAQPVHDNLRTESVFRLFVEAMEGSTKEEATVGYHSLAASLISSRLHYPMTVLVGQLDHAASAEAKTWFAGLSQPLPCDIHPLALRTLSKPTEYGESGTRSTAPQAAAAFIVHRIGVECRSKSKVFTTCNVVADNKFNVKTVFSDTMKSVHPGSLTLLYANGDSDISELEISPNELKTVKLVF